MKLRIALGVAALGMLSACFGSSAQSEKSEETQAAYLLAGMLDNFTHDGTRTEQTATSPAMFMLHGRGSDTLGTMTVTKVGECQYRFDFKGGAGVGDIEVVRDLRNGDPDKATGDKGLDVIVPGMTGSCKAVHSPNSGLKQVGCSFVRPDATIHFFGAPPLDKEKAGLKAFRAKYCQ